MNRNMSHRRQVLGFGCGNTAKAGITVRTERAEGVRVAKLRVHPGHLDAVGSGIASAATTAPTATRTTIPPTGRDPVSIAAADAVCARMAQIQAYSGHAAQVVAAAGTMLRADARAYARKTQPTRAPWARPDAVQHRRRHRAKSPAHHRSPPPRRHQGRPSRRRFPVGGLRNCSTVAPGPRRCPRPPPT
jgi:hypothetical protein